jgi:dolichol-phosphate mannosyltransferase
VSKLSVVIAAYDEEGNVEPLTRRLVAALGAMDGWDWEVLYVVEGRDRTRERVEALAAELGRVRLIYREQRTGIGAAFRRGFAALPADVDYVATMDADLNHQPEELPRLLDAALSSGCDLLIGSRMVPGGKVYGIPLWKRALSRWVNRLMRHLYGVHVADKTSGYRVYRASALRQLGFESDAFAFLPELLIRFERAGMSIVEAPICFDFRHHGRSKMALWQTSVSYLALLSSRLGRRRRRRSADAPR